MSLFLVAVRLFVCLLFASSFVGFGSRTNGAATATLLVGQRQSERPLFRAARARTLTALRVCSFCTLACLLASITRFGRHKSHTHTQCSRHITCREICTLLTSLLLVALGARLHFARLNHTFRARARVCVYVCALTYVTTKDDIDFCRRRRCRRHPIPPHGLGNSIDDRVYMWPLA